MEELRNTLLMGKYIDAYRSFMAFMQNPEETPAADVVMVFPEQLSSYAKKATSYCLQILSESREKYEAHIRFGQLVIWKEVLSTYVVMEDLRDRILYFQLTPDMRSYSITCNELSRILSLYSSMQAAMSRLEDILGVDRFLDRVSEGTFSILNNLLSEAKVDIEKKSRIAKQKFIGEWNNTNVFKVIAHKLIKPDTANLICDQMTSPCKQVILFIIDGLGYCQYQWQQNIDAQRENFTFDENVFTWLKKTETSKELILGSSYITDTAAGLAQIYLGEPPTSTGIVASKFYERGASVNFLPTKTIPSNEFNHFFYCNNSITDIVNSYGYSSKVFYCSRYQNPPSGFSSTTFKSAEVEQVVPPERVFSILTEEINQGANSGLQVVYLTGIDNSGHTMGAYSAFEKYEHQKINKLFRNFLIELAFNSPQLFDGTRSILVTADHGMFESSNIIINRYEIHDFLKSVGLQGVKMVENNRAMFFYSDASTPSDLAQLLSDYFRSRKISVDVSSKEDSDFAEHFFANNSQRIVPDVVARFIGEGLFFTSNYVNEHLLHYGGHGGFSVDETFVPLIEINLNQRLLDKIIERFLSKK